MSRHYSDGIIKTYKDSLPPKPPTETYSIYLARMTEQFKRSHQFQLPGDLSYFRELLGNHGAGPVPMPGVLTKQLDLAFDAHVLGNQPGVGWHSESVHANGTPGYSYLNSRPPAPSKGTYRADTVRVANANKAGNNGVSAFFPATMTIATIREEALYVANVGAPTIANNQTITGLGRRTGILIDCLMNGNTIVSAYPHI